MIQTIEKIHYEKRSRKVGRILIDVHSFVCTKQGKIFTINDYVLKEDGTREIYSAREVYRSNEQLNQLDAYLEAIHDFSKLSSQEKEWKKIELGLMLDIQSDIDDNGETIYELKPTDWEFTEKNN